MKQIFFEGNSICLNKAEEEYHIALPAVADFSGQEGIRLYVELLGEGVAELEVVLLPLSIARPEFFPAITGNIFVAGMGGHTVELPFEQFDFPQMVRAFLNYVDGVLIRLKQGVSVQLKRAEADIMGDFFVRTVCNGKAGNNGEWVEYPIFIENLAARQRFVNIRQCRYGKECLPVKYEPYLLLEAGECKECVVRILITEDLPAGGLEKSNFLFVPDGEAKKARTLCFSTVKRREHPYLLLSEEQWKARGEAILSDKNLSAAFEKNYLQKAREWEVPPPSTKKDFVYPSYVQNELFASVVSLKITGEEIYRKKAMDFFSGLLDRERGYLSTEKSYFEFIESKKEYARGDFKVHRAQNAGWVQEAEFFNRVAVCYDLLHPFFTSEEHKKIEACLHGYMDFASWRLTDGDGNNFQIAESAAGLLCAMVLQDQNMVERFLYGYNGVVDLISAVFLDDGMYFEEASGYVRLAGELFFDIANAAENFGISIKEIRVPASFDRKILHAPWAMRECWAEDQKPFLGMSFSRFEKFTSATRGLKEFFDCTAKLLTEDGILFSINDSNEQDFTKLYQKAYYLYGDEKYRKIAEKAGEPELLFVREEGSKEKYKDKFLERKIGEQTDREEESLLLPGAGFGILRCGDCQTVLKFGVHGGYHGHFDRLSLASFFSGGKTFHNNEYAWYGYGSFLFKMWVQTSMAHNMVVVDGRMQKPSPCKCTYYKAKGEVFLENCTKDNDNAMVSDGIGKEDNLAGEKRQQGSGEDTFCAVCAETITEWMDPPYGGQTPYPLSFPKEKCEKEGRYILMPEKLRGQGEIGEFSEPIFQRRLLVLFHGYCIVWDYLCGKQDHRYDCLYHPMGRFDNEEEIVFHRRERLFSDPFGAGQFITNCHTAWTDGATCLRFHDASSRVNPNDIMDFTPESAVWRAWPDSGEVTVARYPQRSDHFTAEELAEKANFLQEPLKKTVSFTAWGREAEFITLLEAGEKTGKIKEIRCEDFSTLIITEDTGNKWKIVADGINDFSPSQEENRGKKIAKKREISVKIFK